MLLAGIFSAIHAQQLSREQLRKRLFFPDFLQEVQDAARRPAANAYYRLDSIVYMDYDATSGSYTTSQKDHFGWYIKRNVSYIPYSWDPSANTYTHNQEWLYSYVNIHSDDLSEALIRYDLGSGIVDYFRLRHQYDSQGRLTDYFGDYYDYSTGQIENYDNDHFVYSGNNTKPDWDYYKLYDASQSAYVDYARVHYISYNSNGILEQAQIDLWDSSSSSWVPAMKLTRTFSGGDIVSEVEQNWDDTSSSWVNSERETYSYSTSGNQKTIEMVAQSWNSTSGSWENNDKVITVININNNKVLSIENYSWDSGSWLGQVKWDYTYSGNIVRLEYTEWDNTAGTWKSGPTYMGEYAYNINIPATDLLIPKKYTGLYAFYDEISSDGLSWEDIQKDPFPYALNTVSHYYRNDPSQPWELRRTDFYYYNNTLDVENPQVLAHKLYPNPTKGSVRIHVQAGTFKFRLYDMTGKMIFTGHYSNNEEIHLPDLEKGIYPYQVITSEGVISGKIVHR